MPHFHSDRDIDLNLTAGVVRRFEEHLAEAAAVRLVTGSHWVTLRLGMPADVDLLMTLVTLALQAHQRWPVPGDAALMACNGPRSAPPSLILNGDRGTPFQAAGNND